MVNPRLVPWVLNKRSDSIYYTHLVPLLKGFLRLIFDVG